MPNDLCWAYSSVTEPTEMSVYLDLCDQVFRYPGPREEQNNPNMPYTE